MTPTATALDQDPPRSTGTLGRLDGPRPRVRGTRVRGGVRRPACLRRWLALALTGLATLGVLVACPAPVEAAGSAAGDWAWPVRPPVAVLVEFRPPEQPWLPGHRGIDLAAPPGSPIYSAGPGIVLFASRVGGKGVVSVGHRSGLRTTYEPVSPLVSSGQRVHQGQRIGVIEPGSTHCGRAPGCLHWGLRRGLAYLDPLMLVADRRPVLLPVMQEYEPPAGEALGVPEVRDAPGHAPEAARVPGAADPDDSFGTVPVGPSALTAAGLGVLGAVLGRRRGLTPESSHSARTARRPRLRYRSRR